MNPYTRLSWCKMWADRSRKTAEIILDLAMPGRWLRHMCADSDTNRVSRPVE